MRMSWQVCVALQPAVPLEPLSLQWAPPLTGKAAACRSLKSAALLFFCADVVATAAAAEDVASSTLPSTHTLTPPDETL